MPRVVGVRFNPVTKIYFFDPTSFSNLEPEDRVIVETARGQELGTVAASVREVSNEEIKGKLKRVVRRATPVDLMEAAKHKEQESTAIAKCNELVAQMEIPIKIIQANYSYDGSRLLFAFTSEQRVDFRDLVKELARTLRTRIEMKQVGARDETKIIDGYGRCGRRLCCSSWLTEFHPVSIRMAKQQGLPLAPSEISGMCGRLLCCLAYEDEFYVEMRKLMPRVNTQVQTSEGVIGTVRGLNVVKETVLLEAEPGEAYQEVELAELIPLSATPKAKPPTPSNEPEPKAEPASPPAQVKEKQPRSADRPRNRRSRPANKVAQKDGSAPSSAEPKNKQSRSGSGSEQKSRRSRSGGKGRRNRPPRSDNGPKKQGD